MYDLGRAPLPAQSEVIGAVNSFSAPTDVVVCAAGSLPGELHKLWRTRDRKQYHVEYGFSCMGYEIAGALGVKLAAPEREVYSLVGDGSYLMLSEAIVTYMDGLGLSLPDGVQLAFCPMKMKPWLQTASAIQNPYHGSAMPTCGEFR